MSAFGGKADIAVGAFGYAGSSVHHPAA